MAMRLDIDFATPLTRDERIEFLLAIACLAKSRSVRWAQGGFGAVVLGEAMGRDRVADALRATGLPVAEIRSSLSEEEDEQADDGDGEGGPKRERLRPIGR